MSPTEVGGLAAGLLGTMGGILILAGVFVHAISECRDWIAWEEWPRALIAFGAAVLALGGILALGFLVVMIMIALGL